MNPHSKCPLPMSQKKSNILKKLCGDKGLVPFGSTKEIIISNFFTVLTTQNIATVSLQHYTTKNKHSLHILTSLMPLLLTLILCLEHLIVFFCMQIGIFFIQIVSGLLGILSVYSMRRRLEMSYSWDLEHLFNEKEIRDVIFGLVLKRPRAQMDFLLSFFKKFETLSSWILSTQFYNYVIDLRYFNYALVALIPKKICASIANEFQPISLLNVVFKIITKFLANRLRPCIHLLVGQVQSVFIKNRYILDMKFLQLHITSILRRFSLSLTLRRLLVLLVGTSSLSYYCQKGCGNDGLVGLKHVYSPGHHPSLLMRSRATTFNVVRVSSKTPLFLLSHRSMNPLPSR